MLVQCKPGRNVMGLGERRRDLNVSVRVSIYAPIHIRLIPILCF